MVCQLCVIVVGLVLLTHVIVLYNLARGDPRLPLHLVVVVEALPVHPRVPYCAHLARGLEPPLESVQDPEDESGRGLRCETCVHAELGRTNSQKFLLVSCLLFAQTKKLAP